ncbi:hypothetical protein [Streptomyces sp. DH8]|uniref:hypothetical protein n=1 Tax=Streptomyces sp. DH8 TaxID=2857008 RepID=UPI001E576AC2|nr:hypothetical protein [Streptomyces sp. DH8]
MDEVDVAAGGIRAGEGHPATGKVRILEVNGAVDGDAGEVEVAALPGAVGSLGASVVVADETQDCVPDLAKGRLVLQYGFVIYPLAAGASGRR